jgi:hypothetical protein
MSFFEILPPPVLFFALGFAAAALRSDLSVPDALAKTLSLYLMMAIGLKGGIAIAQPGASAGHYCRCRPMRCCVPRHCLIRQRRRRFPPIMARSAW